MSIHASFTLREYRSSDAEGVVTMLNAGRAVPRAVVDGVGNIRLIRYVPFSSSMAVMEGSNGKIVGFAYVADRENSFVFETGGGIHPDHQASAVGPMLAKWAQDEAIRLSGHAPQDVRCVLQVNIFETERETIRLFEKEGFSKVREWAHYEMHFGDAPILPVSSDGVKVRPFAIDQDDDWDLIGPVQDAAFMDHWGAYSLPPVENTEPENSDETEGEEAALDFSYSNANGYCFIAFVGDETAGGILCNAKLVEFEHTGRVGSIFTDPKFRRKGVGRALMLSAFHAFHQNGMRRVILDTDSQSFTDSAGFYTSLGMNIYRHELLYEKEIRPGREIRRLVK